MFLVVLVLNSLIVLKRGFHHESLGHVALTSNSFPVSRRIHLCKPMVIRLHISRHNVFRIPSRARASATEGRHLKGVIVLCVVHFDLMVERYSTIRVGAFWVDGPSLVPWRRLLKFVVLLGPLVTRLCLFAAS